MRTLPDTIGSETLLKAVDMPELSAMGEAILDRLDYCGPAGIDFKRDPRTGRFKVIEINFRFGLSDGLPVDCGIDFPYIYYRDALGFETQRTTATDFNRVWFWFEKDFLWLRYYGQEKQIGWKQWSAHWWKHKHSYAAYAKDDLQPFWYTAKNMLAYYGKGFLQRIGLTSADIGQ